MSIVRPTLIVNAEVARQNIRRAFAKFNDLNIRFRPHFKTHQSLAVASWFRETGISAITVTSVEMAFRFASHGWRDILIAMPFNPEQSAELNHFPPETTLHLLVDHPATVRLLAARLKREVDLWIKIDTGYQRCGIPSFLLDRVLHLGHEISTKNGLHLRGLLSHAGHSYKASGKNEILRVHAESLEQLNTLRGKLKKLGFPDLEISVGDTPACSLASAFPGVQEVRCGNFVFYDVMQSRLGSCTLDDVAVRLVCPVIGCYPWRGEVVVRGGKIHLSGDAIADRDGILFYGLVAPYSKENPWPLPIAEARVRALSQEHGVIEVGRSMAESLNPGDCLAILPIHSCLTVDLAGEMQTLQGDSLDTMRRQ